MKLLIDSANLKRIKGLYEHYPCDGVTTNPSILCREDSTKSPVEILKEIRAFLPKEDELHAQVIATTKEEIILEALFMREVLGENFFAKIPVTLEGMAAIKVLSKEGVSITATTIYTAMQGLIAAKAGAKYLAPYVNQISVYGGDGVFTCSVLQDMLVYGGYEAKILAASFKNTEQVEKLAIAGIASATLNPDLFELLLRHPLTDEAVNGFSLNFENKYGKAKKMYDFS